MKRRASARIPPASLSPVFANVGEHLPTIARRDPAWRFAAGCVGVGCFGAVVFSSLNHGRLQVSQAQAHAPPPVVAAPLTAAPVGPPQPAAAPPAPPRPSTATPWDPMGQGGAPALVLDLGDQQLAPDQAAAALAAQRPAGPPGPGANPALMNPNATPDERFSERIGGSAVTTVRASRLPNTALIAPQGTIIPAVLETALNSDLPGFASAIVSRDVRGYDNSTVLIPKGSKLVGQYKSAVSPGQSRAFVVWTRLLTPDGVSIDLGSPATDELGRGGVAGETNTHFLRRFGVSLMTSVITAGLAAAAATGGGGAAIVLNSPTTAGGSVTSAMAQDVNIPDTISVKPGAAIRVFVARDLDFSSVMERKPE